ncbi:GlxA family transcriptional regulator [Rhizobium metallidurans]|uniref:Transcriptional regulator GlxA family with amidase domain n=1 Tax=Rhizobium metallidurans TaxID=1265931 RepID=A0A7W6CS48_9HYPH|nr:GlxA family transcriptional regulator [Rhizobium metallidurans]MBB3966148.1 transcriptional regulator GlxA family with amidase domain [Rhizobium metallidurans]
MSTQLYHHSALFSEQGIRRIGVILVDGYALISLAATVEPLRAANILSKTKLYDFTFITAEGGRAQSSIGIAFDAIEMRSAPVDFDLVFLVAGGNPILYENVELGHYLKRLTRQNVPLGGISGAPAILARYGLMRHRRFTIHWEHFDSLKEMSQDFNLEKSLYVIDRDRYTSAGGTGTLDLLINIISKNHGRVLAQQVSDWFMHTETRLSEAPQKAGLEQKYNIHHPAALAAVELMHNNLADRLTLEEIAGRAHISARQLNRVFVEMLDMSVMEFYRHISLDRAAQLLKQTVLPISEVALATGFSNASHFTRIFQARFATTPKAMRVAARAVAFDKERP